MQRSKIRQFVLLLGLILPAARCMASDGHSTEGYEPIVVKEAKVQGCPKGSTIQASISGHTLTVMFSQNIGHVVVEIATASGTTVNCVSVLTPNGMQCYIPTAGDYVVTFTLANGDEYYGEFTVTD